MVWTAFQAASPPRAVTLRSTICSAVNGGSVGARATAGAAVATAAGLTAGLGAAAAFRAVAIKTSPTIVVPDARITDITPVLLDRWVQQRVVIPDFDNHRVGQRARVPCPQGRRPDACDHNALVCAARSIASASQSYLGELFS